MMILPLRRAVPSITVSGMLLFIGALLFTLPAQGADKEIRGVDFSHYDVPLYEQVVNHIKVRVTARLGTGKNTRDRYFIIPYAYENRGNDPEFSHSFISVIRVFADGKETRKTTGLGLRTGTYKNRNFEAFTISWLPKDFDKNPHLCVFEGFGSRLIAKWNQCPLSPGKSFNLQATLKMAVGAKVAVGMWGPYEISKPGFDLGIKRLRLLETGKIKYRADDRLYRQDRVAINCFHAMAGLDELFPNGGLFGTGFKMWGLNGTRRVLIEYTTKASNKGLLLEPVDIKKDLYGFVYAPTPDGRGMYHPFAHDAWAYHQ
jgi:hypothetical protein